MIHIQIVNFNGQNCPLSSVPFLHYRETASMQSQNYGYGMPVWMRDISHTPHPCHEEL